MTFPRSKNIKKYVCLFFFFCIFLGYTQQQPFFLCEVLVGLQTKCGRSWVADRFFFGGFAWFYQVPSRKVTAGPPLGSSPKDSIDGGGGLLLRNDLHLLFSRGQHSPGSREVQFKTGAVEPEVERGNFRWSSGASTIK